MAEALANLQAVERRSYTTELRSIEETNRRVPDSMVKIMNKNITVGHHDKTESIQISQKKGDENETQSSIETRPEKRDIPENLSLEAQDNMQQQSNDETKTHDQQNMEPQRGVEKKGRDIRFRLEQFYNRQRTKKQQFQAQQQEQEMKLQQEQEQEPTQQQQQPLASHFHLYALVEKLANAVETGTRDQNSNAMVTELSSYFNKSQQMLNSVSEALGFKTMYVDWQKRKLEDTEKLLQQRRELIVEYRKSIEDILKI
ncbi:unnamed protein product [Brassica rapa]|uniref:Mediator of RNA polymerase II transcription subunit 9 n=2 Tax=Brassica TaxID=3705 RepID=A0A3P6B9C1_BRACM|nr:unnamed protein product [Brassica napus]CAG7901594.1 unnamed protein product [Brassica rapa]CDY44298.1 BnaA07g07820D [Brassica napus]VDC97083.1 unnamed protein product [Brassica rapa]